MWPCLRSDSAIGLLGSRERHTRPDHACLFHYCGIRVIWLNFPDPALRSFLDIHIRLTVSCSCAAFQRGRQRARDAGLNGSKIFTARFVSAVIVSTCPAAVAASAAVGLLSQSVVLSGVVLRSGLLMACHFPPAYVLVKTWNGLALNAAASVLVSVMAHDHRIHLGCVHMLCAAWLLLAGLCSRT